MSDSDAYSRRHYGIPAGLNLVASGVSTQEAAPDCHFAIRSRVTSTRTSEFSNEAISGWRGSAAWNIYMTSQTKWTCVKATVSMQMSCFM